LAGTIARCAAILVLLAFAGPAFAIGSSSGGSSSDGASMAEAEKAVKAEDYPRAIDLLKKVLKVQPRNPDAYNYLGFSHRKIGETSLALRYYQTALDIDPQHVGANEYLGELYLEMGDVPKAEERLAVLRASCGRCEAYEELAEKIAARKATN